LQRFFEGQTLRVRVYAERWIHVGILASLLKWIVLGRACWVFYGFSVCSVLSEFGLGNEHANFPCLALMFTDRLALLNPIMSKTARFSFSINAVS